MSNTRANTSSDTRHMPNSATHNPYYAEAARPQDIYKRFLTGVVLCSVVHRGVDMSVDKVVYVCVHILFG